MGNRTSFAGESSIVSLVAPTAITTTANQTGIDIGAYEGAASVVLTSAAGGGTTLTTNGAFGSDTGWTKGTGWTIDTGKAVFAGHTSASALAQNQACTEDAYYTVVFTVSDWTAGSIAAVLGGTAGTSRAANGTYTEVIKCGAGVDPKLAMTATSTFRGKIDDVAVYDVTLDVHLEHSHDDSTYADISGATFSTVYGIASTQKLAINCDTCRRYLRAVTTTAGTDETFTCAMTFQGVKKDTGASY